MTGKNETKIEEGKNLKKLLKRVRKATTISRKKFGSMSDLIELRRAFDKYNNEGD